MKTKYYIDLGRAKSKALDDIYSLLKQNISHVMLSGEGNENGEKTTIYRCRVISKKATLHAQHTLFNLCHCFARLQRETSRNFLVTRFMEEMSYMFLFSFFSLLLIFTLVTASISDFLTVATKFSCCSSTKKCLLCFLSLTLTLCCSFSG